MRARAPRRARAAGRAGGARRHLNQRRVHPDEGPGQGRGDRPWLGGAAPSSACAPTVRDRRPGGHGPRAARDRRRAPLLRGPCSSRTACCCVRGQARFRGGRARVDGRGRRDRARRRADRARHRRAPVDRADIPGLDDAPFVTSDDLMRLTDLPGLARDRRRPGRSRWSSPRPRPPRRRGDAGLRGECAAARRGARGAARRSCASSHARAWTSSPRRADIRLRATCPAAELAWDGGSGDRRAAALATGPRADA